MKDLRDRARAALTDQAAGIVLGWESWRQGARPAWVTDPAGVDRLIFDHRCVHNLAVCLSPRRRQRWPAGRLAVVVKPCDAKAVAGLLRENQVRREDVVLIGVRCGGVARRPDAESLTAATVAPRCGRCTSREPTLADHIVGEMPPAPPAPAAAAPAEVAAIEAMSFAERFAFWRQAFARCVRCHACRQVCPLCYCERCVADKSQPQWLETSPHGRGNLAFHVTRALHLAGRCVECGECERACPVDVPLGLLARKLAAVVEERFGHRPSDDPAVAAPIGAHRLEDGQEFIL